MKLRWAGDRVIRGATALDCLRHHLHSDHSAAAQRGAVDGVMERIAKTFQLDASYAALPTLEERAAAFVAAAIAVGLLEDLAGQKPTEDA